MMRKSLSLLLSAGLLLPFTAESSWNVKSDFQLHLTEPLFDQLIGDFWTSLQGTQTINVGNTSFRPDSNTNVQVNGIHVNVDYSFPLPQRIDPARREWKLASNSIGGSITADQILITQRQIIESHGIIFETNVTAECRNIALVLPAGSANISAVVKAEVAQNQIQLTLPSYDANWPSGAWQIQALNCPQIGGIKGAVQEKIAAFMSSFQNVDSTVNAALMQQFQKWSSEASALLLTQQQLPSNDEGMKIFYEPKSAVENSGNGLLLSGNLRFEFPFVAQGQEINQEFNLPANTKIVPKATPQLILPFQTLKGLMMGKYFMGSLEYSLRSPEIPAFTKFMQSRFQQMLAWGDLHHFATDTVFLFQFQPLGPPAFDNEIASSAGVIKGDLTMPISAKMWAPINGTYTPYVEFRTLALGPTALSLTPEGKIKFNVSLSKQPVAYSVAKNYLDLRGKSSLKISSDTVGAAVRDSLNADGIQLSLPTFKVGEKLNLVPQNWDLIQNKVLRLDFVAKTPAAMAAKAAAVAKK